jgi:hypothetical protein
MYRKITIPKPKGGVRELHDPEPGLKYAQRMVLDKILSKFPVHDHIGAYVDARGVKYTTERHAGHAVIIELDVKNFFPSTTRRMVRSFFKDLGWPTSPAHIIADLLTVPLSPHLSVVPQGAPSSPSLCNIIGNHRFDQHVLRYLTTLDPGWQYTRYSDNLIISHPQVRAREEIDRVKSEVRRILLRAGYNAHPKKTKVMRNNHPKAPQRLLGLTVNTTPNIPSDVYRKLRAQLHRALTHGLEAVTDVPPTTTALPYLEGRVRYYLHINPASHKIQQLLGDVELLKRTQPRAVFSAQNSSSTESAA